MTNEEKFELITRGLDEVITEDDLKALIESDEPLKHYIGFELSGQTHLGTGLITMIKIRDFMAAGVDTKIFLADWHTWINDKLGRDMHIIQSVGVHYFKEAFRASMKAVGGDPGKLNFLLGSKLYEHNNAYWETVIHVAKHTSLSRVQRSISIMGRKEGEAVDFAILIYPIMQVADIFSQGLSLAHGGMDQRKAHVVMRDVASKLPSDYLNASHNHKPVALHQHLILGLGKPPQWPLQGKVDYDFWEDVKMSKSKPETCVFIHDESADIERKVNNAFCPEGEVGFNPVLDWAKHLVWPIRGGLSIKRKAEHGGNIEYNNYDDLEKDFADKKLHPQDLKQALAKSLIDILAPAREHFASGKPAEVLEEMQKLTVTR